MAKIRKLSILDRPKIKEMISFLTLDVSSHYSKIFVPFPIDIAHSLLPLKYKWLPESYVGVNGKKLNALVSVLPCRGNKFKLKIIKFFLNENSYETGAQLIEYIFSHYGALGVNTFFSSIDYKHEELLDLLIKDCGFRLCSSEQLWKINQAPVFNNIIGEDYNIREFVNKDADIVSDINNDNIYPYYRYSIASNGSEYKTYDLFGLCKNVNQKFVIENKKNKKICGYFNIESENGIDYIFDIIVVQYIEDLFNDIVNCIINQIKRKKSQFNLYFVNKKYKTTGVKYENFLKLNNCELKSEQAFLVKDFYKPIKDTNKLIRSAVLFSDISGKVAFKIKK